MPTRLARRDSRSSLEPQLKYGSSEFEETDDYEDPFFEADEADDVPLPGSSDQDEREAHLEFDVDEILRKLHKQGADSLTFEERQTLLSASRDIKDRRG